MSNLGIISNKPKQEIRVVVAMSGGVDSSVAAVMLHKEGYNVIGLTMQLYNNNNENKQTKSCCAVRDIQDARSVADKFGFDHYVLNYESVFKEEVIEDFTSSYLNGETPIPCIRCNESVKFRDMIKLARDLKADALATGHYVRRLQGTKKIELHSALDSTKDQSYFLFSTKQDQLDYVYFPLGDYSKVQTRDLAKQFGLKIFDKSDSQDLCFIGNDHYANFIKKLHPDRILPGDIVHVSGKILGIHNGIVNYTLGQRKGLGISWSDPLYVVRIDAKNNRIVVGGSEDLEIQEFFLKDVNWLGDISLSNIEVDVSVKIRSMHKAIPAKISRHNGDIVKVRLLSIERAVTPGQACVFYQGARVFGGGWIFNKDTPGGINS